MKMLSDIKIAQNNKMNNIASIAKKIGINEDDLELYGKYKAKINVDSINKNKKGKLILVTSINPTSAGEGKTTTSIGLADSLNMIGRQTILCLREPSLGPCFGIKGGACGGGYSQVVPMEEINLHFTGDMHAITSANNLLAAMIDNSIYHGNELNIDPKTICLKRVVDLNDRALRHIVIDSNNDLARETGFDITVSSEIMAILCLSKDLTDLKKKLSNMTIGYTYKGDRITTADLKAEGAMTLLLKDAIKPNLVQTLEGNPVIIHGGPFANIAHGCNSLIATKTALKLSDYVVTEAGFGADLGAEKFFDLKCRIGNLKPNIVVLVATIRALKLHGGVNKNDLNKPDVTALCKGFSNLEKHIENIRKYNLPVIVAINKFDSDTKEEIDILINKCQSLKAEAVINDTYSCGFAGGIELATQVVNLIDENKAHFKLLYNDNISITDKIEAIATKIYGADDVVYSEDAMNSIIKYTKMGFDNLPVCIAKTQYSFSDDALLLGRPKNFTFHIKEVKLSSGAGFIIALAGNIMTMPGLPKEPAAKKININKNNVITGLF